MTKFGPKQVKMSLKLVFFLFLMFGSLVFFEIGYNDSLQQCLTSSRGKVQEKNFGHQIWAKGTNSRPKTSFFLPFSQVCFISLP